VTECCPWRADGDAAGAVGAAPADDEAMHVEVALAQGIEVDRAGRNVSVRHVRTADLPE